MIIGMILAGGTGNRMSSSAVPKQFLMLNDKPVIVHTVTRFLESEGIDRTILLCPKEWIQHTQNLLEEYFPKNQITVIAGGECRNDTIMKGISCIERHFEIRDVDLLTHDCARPLVSGKTIGRIIKAIGEGRACSSVIPATDTIYESKDGKHLDSIPKREDCYRVQTPQGFNAYDFKYCYENLSDDERREITDAIGVLHRFNRDVELVEGNRDNIKLTYPLDLEVAEVLIKLAD